MDSTLRRAGGLLALAGILGSGDKPPAQQAPDRPAARLDAQSAQRRAEPPVLPATRLEEGSGTNGLDGARAVSLAFAEPMPVRDVLLLLFRGTAVSLVFEPGVSGAFAGELARLTLRQALEAVLAPAGLDYAAQGDVVRVFPRRPRTRLFDVGRGDVTRTWRRRLLGTGPGGEPQTELASASDGDFLGDLRDGVRALLSDAGRVHLDRKAGLVQVTDFADRLEQVGLYLEAVSTRAARQVRLDARVLEIALRSAAGVDWLRLSAQAGSGLRPGSGPGVRLDDFEAFLRALQAFGTPRVIAAPQVTALQNEPAVIRIAADGAAASASPDGILRGHEGLVLTIVPHIEADGVVEITVSPTFSGASAGRTSTVETDTRVRVPAGETAVVSGLIREAGGYGGDATTARVELIVLVTPTLVGDGRRTAGAP